jgi:hypothetical protein
MDRNPIAGHAQIVELAIALADRAVGFEVSPTRLRWTGATDPEADAPVVAWELAGEGAGETALDDPVAIAPLAARYPMPVCMLDELARRCVARDASACAAVAEGIGVDARWARAVAGALLAAGSPPRIIADDTGELVTDEIFRALRVMPDGALAGIDGYESVVVAGDRRIALPKGPLDPIDWLRLFDGNALPAITVPPRQIRRRVHVSNGWVLTFTNERVVPSVGWVAQQLAWTQLARDARVVHAWDREVRDLVEADGVVWCAAPDGLWRLAGGEPPVRVWAGNANGLAIRDGVAWLATKAKALVGLDLASGVEIACVPLPYAGYRVWAAPGGLLVSTFADACWIVGNQVVQILEGRRDVGFAILADRTAAASSGEQISILEPSGRLRACLPMPFDGMICCATRDRFVFGPVSGGIDRVRPDALIALDRDGRVTARLPGQFNASAIVAGDEVVHAVQIEPRRGVVRWDPHGTASDGIVSPPPRRPTERGVTRLGWRVINPRDDWPEVGIEIRHGNALLLDGTYGGSTGLASEVAIRVTDGAIATFARCTLHPPGDGAVVQRGSTVFAIHCRLPSTPTRWTLGRDCHFVAIDCDGRSFIASGQGTDVFTAA